MRLQVGYWSSRRQCNNYSNDNSSNSNSKGNSSRPPTPNSNTKRSKISSVLCNSRWVAEGSEPASARVSAARSRTQVVRALDSAACLAAAWDSWGSREGATASAEGRFRNGGALGLGMPVTGAGFGGLGAGTGLDGGGASGAGGEGGVGMGGMSSGPTGGVTMDMYQSFMHRSGEGQ